ncbi:unnamed protein product, partial [Amoebophrya sp. A25]
PTLQQKRPSCGTPTLNSSRRGGGLRRSGPSVDSLVDLASAGEEALPPAARSAYDEISLFPLFSDAACSSAVHLGRGGDDGRDTDTVLPEVLGKNMEFQMVRGGDFQSADGRLEVGGDTDTR